MIKPDLKGVKVMDMHVCRCMCRAHSNLQNTADRPAATTYHVYKPVTV